jgi:PTH1 family peptidyl-tRNA hydrolase
MFLIVGLGNPGDEYEKTRHNAGFILLDHIVDSSDWDFMSGANSFFYKTKIGEHDVKFLKPQTHMNNSGTAVSYIVKKNNLKSEQVIVIHDEIDLPVGEYKISFGSGHAGHNGVASITEALGTKEYYRIRVGVSPKDDEGNTRRPVGGEQADFVLKNMSKVDFEKIIELSENIKKEIEGIIKK